MARGLAPMDASTRALLHELRWRKPPREGRRLWVALVIAVILHAFFGAFVWFQMKPRPLPPTRIALRLDNALRVRLIPHVPTVPPPTLDMPVPPPVATSKPPPRPVHAPRSNDAMIVSMPASSTAAPAQPLLFDPTGRILLPSTAASALPPAAGYVQHTPQGDTQIMHDRDTVNYKPTRFAGAWQDHGSAIDDALQKVVDKTTMKTTINLPKGVRIHCAVSLAMLAGGCGGDPPPPPPSNDGDERLNMAATPLTGGVPKPKVHGSADCIAAYRAHQPLPYGCPVDTPTQAVDAELRERAARGTLPVQGQP
jgi:hypothetical protein